MPSDRTAVPMAIQRALIDKVGNRCPYPACSNHLVYLHHIQEWHIYHTHDKQHMLALCGACHDHVHWGKLRIDDATLYRWKRQAQGQTPSEA